MKLTKKQKQLLDFIEGFISGQGYSPTFREIMQALGYKSVSTVAKHIDGLVAQGALIKREGKARSLELGINHEVDTTGATKPWWYHLEQEAKKREAAADEAAHEEATILRKALDIVKGA
jgi:lexA DNA binding domain